MKTIKTLLIGALLVSSALGATAQTEVTIDSEKIVVKKHEKNLVIGGEEGIIYLETINANDDTKSSKKYDSNKWKPSRGKFAGVSVNFNGLVQNLSEMHLPANARFMDLTPASIGVDINFADLVLFSHKRFGIVTGIGLESNNFCFENNITLTKDASGYIVPDYSYDQAGIHLQKSKLTTTYLNIPILFEFKLGKMGYRGKAPGWISGGVIGGLLIQGYTKVKTAEFGKEKNFNNQNLRNFHYGFIVSGGYKNIGLTAKYYPHSIFRSGEGPEVQQVSIGLGLVF